MSSDDMPSVELPKSAAGNEVGQRLGAIAWALFFIWIGAAILADIGWGWSLLGIGVIILATQAGRRYEGLSIERFWIACGVVFFLSGLWRLINLPWPLAPVLLILFGLAVLGSVLVDKGRFSKR